MSSTTNMFRPDPWLMRDDFTMELQENNTYTGSVESTSQLQERVPLGNCCCPCQPHDVTTPVLRLRSDVLNGSGKISLACLHPPDRTRCQW